MTHTDIKLPFKKFELHIIPEEPLILPSYKGSTLRGGFGNVFRKIVCAIKSKDCKDCLLKEKCIYSYIFETSPSSDTKIMRKYKSVPHPFIIEPPLERKHAYTPEDNIKFGLILVGRAIDYLPYFIYTFDELGRIGIGKGRGRYKLKTVKALNEKVVDFNTPISAKAGIQDDSAVIIYDSETKTLKSFKSSNLNLEFETLNLSSNDSKSLTLNFLTPTRIIYNSHLAFDLEFHLLIRQLLRRISMLLYFHCGIDLSTLDFKGIIEKSKDVIVKQKSLKWYDWERYSFRQDTRMKMGGFIGEITFEGNIEPFMPLIKACEMLHVGKGTSFGLGKYVIQE